MLNKNETVAGTINRGQAKVTRRRSKSVFWLVVGAIFVFVGIASILRVSNLWTGTDLEYAEDVVLVLLGTVIIAAAVR